MSTVVYTILTIDITQNNIYFGHIVLYKYLTVTILDLYIYK